MRSLTKIFFVLIFLTLSLLVSNAFCQETYPNRPITMICWSTAGMGDTVTRISCKVAEKALGQPIIVENKPGASGAIAYNYVVNSKPDGYTLGMGVTSNYHILPHLRKLPYSVLTDVTDIMAMMKLKTAFAVKADAPWNTIDEIVAYAKNNPGKFTYAAAGVGTIGHLCLERIATKAGIKWTLVPFKGGGESVTACLGGHTDSVVQNYIDIIPHVNSGKLKLILSLDEKRFPELPNVPCSNEKFGIYTMSYISFFGPKGLPEPIRQKLEDAFKKAKNDSSFMETANQFKQELVFMGGKEYSTLWKSQYEQMGEVIRALGLKE